jgi:hypothetical protein
MRRILIVAAALALIAMGATLVFFFPGTPSAPHAAEKLSATSESRLIGARDPGRMGWRAPNGARNPLGTQQAIDSLHAVPDGTEPER